MPDRGHLTVRCCNGVQLAKGDPLLEFVRQEDRQSLEVVVDAATQVGLRVYVLVRPVMTRGRSACSATRWPRSLAASGRYLSDAARLADGRNA